ncbi:hypothetical protein [Ramlibacter sp. AN1133]|uniref:hypothetical protein n=1 Tax=Ramlibacter sp. AN1133 TaxID=3133429 RepID=UPI0030BE582A
MIPEQRKTHDTRRHQQQPPTPMLLQPEGPLGPQPTPGRTIATGTKPRSASRVLPPHVPRDAALGLQDCHQLLVREFGDKAPSLRTLKRKVKAGELKPYEKQPATKPPKYVWGKIRGHMMPRAVPPEPLAAPGAPGTVSGGVAAAPAITQEQLAGALAAALPPLLEPLLDRLGRLEREVSGLAGVRQTLMLKYDAAAGAALSRADLLDAQVKEMRKLLDVDTQLRRLVTEVSRLASKA